MQEDYPAENIPVAYSGYDSINVFTEDGNVSNEILCKACCEKMIGGTWVEGPTSYAESIAKVKRKHIHFQCSNSGKDWHTQTIHLKIKQRDCPSAKISELLESEIQEILKSKTPTKTNYLHI